MGRKHKRRRGGPAGASPGTLIADPEAPQPLLRAIGYGPDLVEELEVRGVDELRPLIARWPRLWLNVDGLGDASLLEQLGALFGLHRLALEDVLATHQRAKLESYGEHSFLVARMPEGAAPEAAAPEALATEQISIFFAERFLISFQERPGDSFDLVRRRLREGKGRLRSAGTDYLAYALLDAVVDSYYPVVEAAGERIDALEGELLGAGARGLMTRVHRVRRELLVVRRALWPLREVVSALQREETRVAPETRLHLRDLYDHVVELLDIVETLREVGGGLMELHISVVNNRMNEVIKVLTVLSALFMPPMLIASLYGMNFDRSAGPAAMPELGLPLGYPLALAAMAASALGMWLWVRRRGWLAPDEE